MRCGAVRCGARARVRLCARVSVCLCTCVCVRVCFCTCVRVTYVCVRTCVRTCVRVCRYGFSFSGRVVDYYNIAVDKVPDDNEIGIGSIILFPQGKYVAGKSCETGGQRWHQGQVTKIYTENKTTYYDGVHTKGKTDGKFVTYKGYCYDFAHYVRDDFRVGPNVFNILDDTDTGLNTEDVDIYFSSMKPVGVSDNHTSDVSYNPIHIAERLKQKGLKIVEGIT